MERETIRKMDAHGNFETNRWPCPKCGAEFLTYVGQFDSSMCDECDWTEGWIDQPEDSKPYQIDYNHPAKERWVWSKEFSSWREFYEHVMGEPAPDPVPWPSTLPKFGVPNG